MSVNYVEYIISQYCKTESNEIKNKIKRYRYYYNDNPGNATEYAYAKIKNLIEANDMSRIEFSKNTGVSKTSLNNWAASETSMSVYTIQKICDYFNITIADFFKDQYKIKQIAFDKKDVYIASDGTEFFDKYECKKYQMSINKKSKILKEAI